MSNIKIVCRKDKFDANDTKDYNKHKTESRLGDELVIESTRWFMNTETFFNSVKPTLEKYFDKIEKESP